MLPGDATAPRRIADSLLRDALTERFADAAIALECAAVRHNPAALFPAAILTARLATATALNLRHAERRLLAAALEGGMSTAEAMSTISGGIATGVRVELGEVR